MKPIANLEILSIEESKIVCLSKSLKGLSYYQRVKEIDKFKTTELKRLESAIDFIIRDILRQYGIVPNESTKDGLKSAFDTLYVKHKVAIKIIDRYENTNESILYRKDLITIIEDYDETISCANEVKVDYYG